MKKLFCALLALSLGMSGGLAEISLKSSDEFESLYKLAQNYGFKLGACYGYSQMNDSSYLSFVSRHFNSITCTNETKAYSLLDQNASRRSGDGMPRMNYTNADRMISWAMQNGIAVRGHVLVWDAYMTSWFFHEDYLDSKPIASKEVIRARIESYIRQVITHFEQKFPGVIYCWDVVNEAIGDSYGEYAPGDARHIRTYRNGERNPFYDYAGDDYVEFAFLCAKNTVESLGADIKLFYNDYNMFNHKVEPACALIDSINSYATDENGEYRKLVDGIGMQGYIGGYGVQEGCLNDSDILRLENAINAYAKKDVEVQITEMAVRNYDLSKDSEHVAFYGRLFEMLKGVNTPESAPLTAVCIWGINDIPVKNNWNQYAWKQNSPYGGLLTEKNQIKTSFEAVYNALKGD